ncbi:MAG: FKBP-type peptidyl-prolyl cis-trans isomerase [Georgenia sp.]
MRRRPSALAALAVVAALTLAACGGSEPNATESSTAGEGSTSAAATAPGTELPSVDGGFGEAPTITFPGTGAPEGLQVQVLQEGDGTEVGTDDFVVADYQGQVWDSAEVFDSSFERGAPAGFSLNRVIQGWKDGLTGTHVGDRVLLSIPSDLAYGETGQGSIPPGAHLVFVVDVVGTYAPDVAGQADATPVEPAPELPVTMEGDLGAPVSVTVNDGAAEPTETVVTVLATGSGEPVPDTAGTGVLVQLAGNVWDNSSPVSSWETSGVETATIGGGGDLDELAGVPVGSRVVVQVPAVEATATEAARPAIVWVMDVVGTVPAPSVG